MFATCFFPRPPPPPAQRGQCDQTRILLTRLTQPSPPAHCSTQMRNNHLPALGVHVRHACFASSLVVRRVVGAVRCARDWARLLCPREHGPSLRGTRPPLYDPPSLVDPASITICKVILPITGLHPAVSISPLLVADKVSI